MSTEHVRRPRRLLWLLLLPLALGVAALVIRNTRAHAALVASANAEVAEPVTIVQPRVASAPINLNLPATLQPLNEAPIYARVNGYVTHWYADIGQHVTEGELLAQIDSPEVAQALVRARSVLKQASANADLAHVTDERYRELIGSASVSRQEVDQNAQNLIAQRSNVVASKADVMLLERQRGYAAVRAPFTGTITERRTDIGSLVNSGNGGPGSEMFRVARLDVMRIFVSVPETYTQQVSVGLEVSVQVTALPGESFAGTVARTSSSIDVTTRTLRAEIDVPNADGRLLPGAYGQVHFTFDSPARSLLVPASSVLFQAAGPQVGIVTAQNTVELRRVAIGRDFGNVVEINEGLTAEDTLIATPPDYLVQGMLVTVQGHSTMQLPKEGG